jgi:hypothetical protein
LLVMKKKGNVVLSTNEKMEIFIKWERMLSFYFCFHII